MTEQPAPYRPNPTLKRVETGFESGCSDYLTKPIESQELIQMVNGYLAAEKAR